MRTSLDLPDPLFRSLKARAAMDGTTLKDLVVRFVQSGLAQPVESLKSARSPLPVLIAGPLGVALESMSNADIHDLLDAEDDGKAAAFMRHAAGHMP